MALVVICPSCHTRLTFGDDRAGTTFDCPQCDAAITIPVLVEHPTPTPRDADEPEPLPRPEPPTAHDESEDDALDTALRRRYRNQRQRRARARLIRKLVALAILCALTVVSYRAAVRKIAGVGGVAGDRRQLDQSGLDAVVADLNTRPNVSAGRDGTYVQIVVTFPDGFRAILTLTECTTPGEARTGRDRSRQMYVEMLREKNPFASVDELKRVARKMVKLSGRYHLVEGIPAGEGGEGMEYLERFYLLD